MVEDAEALRKLKRPHKRDLRHAWAEGLLQGVVAMLRPGQVVVDCGANQGDVTALLASPGAEVHAFEPDPYNLAKLTERFAGAGNVHLHAAAVGVTAGTVRLLRAANWTEKPDQASVKSTVVAGGHNISASDAIEVPQINFPAFIRGLVDRHGSVAFLKMDIEGAELELLEDLHRQRLLDGVRLTVAETHERKFRDLRPRFATLRATIAAAYPPTRVNLDWV
jgi:FkbM family methyltransferase